MLQSQAPEASGLVARDDAGRLDPRLLWFDPDLQDGQAPLGWIQVRTAGQAIELLGEFIVERLSLRTGEQAEQVIEWLIEQQAADRDPWPTEGLVFHGEHTDMAAAQLAGRLERSVVR